MNHMVMWSATVAYSVSACPWPRVGPFSGVTYDHLKTHGNSPACFGLDVAGAVLDPESDEDPEIDAALEDADDTASDSVIYKCMRECEIYEPHTLAEQFRFGTW